MKTFTVYDQKREPIRYEFVCCDGLLMEISSWNGFEHNKPRGKYYCRLRGQSFLNEPIFTNAVQAMFADESFTDFSSFFEAIKDDELYLPIAKKVMLSKIASASKRIEKASNALAKY